MRVKTKYGWGTLLGISYHTSISYKVLLDNEKPEDEDDPIIPLFRKVEDRTYNCNRVTMISDEGLEIEFDNKITVAQ